MNQRKKRIIRKKLKKRSKSLTLFFSLVVFSILLVTLTITTAVMASLVDDGIFFVVEDYSVEVRNLLITSAVVNLVYGSFMAFLASRLILRPINKVVSGMNNLSDGDFQTRVEFSPTMEKIPVVRNVTESFNKMALELENTEMLRADFVNNFSHEFKTPIVSIAGLAKLARRKDLSEEEREQYLAAIEEESMRLSNMATNVLHLTKIENQKILTDLAEYNLSEQIRSAVLLLEEKWTLKNIELDLVFDEYNIVASEELLKQVWINLFDNAVKFSDVGGTVRISITDVGDSIAVAFTNCGVTIPREKLDKIFNKFYQTDESHSTAGNGIGLAIVKKVVELHYGTVTAASQDGKTTFTVTLPKQ